MEALGRTRSGRLRDLLRVGQRLYRLRDGAVLEIRQVHRADRMIEACYVSAPLTQSAALLPRRRYLVGFPDLVEGYELLVSLQGWRA